MQGDIITFAGLGQLGIYLPSPSGITLIPEAERGTRPRVVGNAPPSSPSTASTSGSSSGGTDKWATVANIVASVSQAFGRRALYPVDGGVEQFGGGEDVTINQGRGLGQDTGATVGKLGDVISAQTARIVQTHPLAVLGVVGVVGYGLFMRNKGRTQGRR